MGLPNDAGELASETEVDAFRRLFPLCFYERHLVESIHPDARPLSGARDTTLALGAVASADGSTLAKIGSTTMLAAIKMEVMTPSVELPDEGCIAVEFHMPPICSQLVRPSRPTEVAPIVSKQLSDTIFSSGMINLKKLFLVIEKSTWMAYVVGDGALFDAALLSTIASFFHLQIPVVSLNDDGKIDVLFEDQDGGNLVWSWSATRRGRSTLSSIPFLLMCILHKNYVLADPTAEDESIMETAECIASTRQRIKEIQNILDDAISGMEVD